MSPWSYFAANWEVIALLLAIICVIYLIVSPADLPRKDRFGLKCVSRSEGYKSYEGDVDGVRVCLEYSDDWTVRLSANCGVVVELFAYRPMAAFDRPWRALFGPLRRIATPAMYGRGWAFYGSPPAAARGLSSRLPPPKVEEPWSLIELSEGRIEAALDCGGEMSRERLLEQVASFRELLDAVRS